MGNTSERSHEEDSDWTFRGRETDIAHIINLLQSPGAKLIAISGLQKIGKTSLINVIYKSCTQRQRDVCRCMFYSFENNSVETPYFQRKWMKELNKFFLNTDFQEDIDDLSDGDCFNIFLDMFCENVTKSNIEIFMFLDDVDKLLKSKLKDTFQTYLKKIMIKCKNLKVVTCSSERINFLNKKCYEQFIVQRLSEQNVLELLKEICLEEETGFTWEENEAYMKSIAKLCDGLPNAAIMAGSLITEDDCLLQPAELVELMIHFRLQSLSQEDYPAEDRLDSYKLQLSNESLGSLRTYLSDLSRNVSAEEFTEVDALDASRDNQVMSVFKLQKLRPLLNKSILSLSEEKRLQLHGVLRECQIALDTAQTIQQGDNAFDISQVTLSIAKENAKKAGLELSDDILTDPRQLEAAVKLLKHNTTMDKAEKKASLLHQGNYTLMTLDKA